MRDRRLPVSLWCQSLAETQLIVRCSYQRHRLAALLLRDLSPFCDRDSLHADFIQPSDRFIRCNRCAQLDIHILAVTCQADAERLSKGHNHVRTHPLAVCDIDPGTTHRLLKIAHDIQMPDKLHDSIF